ncbi:MAG: glycoside hydrolase family 2 [Acidobacteria bacterium]|nr:glycoside hydrolase family 2 [Acidobacteriota bacterium]MCI0722015.1 glycoside hydrolase family 2 [Acidobacteriota bacterium]
MLATDPANHGREHRWWKETQKEAKETKVPWIIQDAFPGYHGVAWYWKDVFVPANHCAEGRYLLKFWEVDYLADVWVNGTHVGTHEGAEDPFIFDATSSIKPGTENRIAVRVLNPTHERTDGIVLGETPHRCKVMPYRAGAAYNHGGITDSVELVLSPAVRIEDLFVLPDPKTGVVKTRITIRNATQKTTEADVECSISSDKDGRVLNLARLRRQLPPGVTVIEDSLKVQAPRLWSLEDPFLYRVMTLLTTKALGSVDKFSCRCGFRDFRFERGYFRLNGRRLFLRSSHTVNHYPIGLQYAHDPDLERRDLINQKAMGFNMVRFIWGGAKRSQLDLCDELGLMVYSESYASYTMADSAHLEERFDRSAAGVIRRDRNHASITIWGLLNEIKDGRQFRHAVDMLPLVHSLDPSRLVFLNSGRFDGQLNIGSICNPGSRNWEYLLGDEGSQAPPAKEMLIRGLGPEGGYWFGRSQEGVGDTHLYSRVPETAATTQILRTIGHDTKPVFLTEYGIGSAVDLWRTVRHFEQLGKESLEDGQFYADKLNQFLADWKRWRLDECFARPADFFAESLKKMAGQRTLGLNAIRSNPNLVGYSLTGMIDHVMTGEGLTTAFRELKPGTIEALFDGWAPLRLCLFAEPRHIYRGARVKLEAVLANEDVLKPGEYPIRLEIVGPNNHRIFEKTVSVRIPQPSGTESPFSVPVFAEEVGLDGQSGEYEFLANFEKGAAAAGGRTSMFLVDPKGMPAVDTEVLMWGEDTELATWLSSRGINVRQFSPGSQQSREVILVSRTPANGGVRAFRELARHIARGSVAVFLSQGVFGRDGHPLGWLPLVNKGEPSFLKADKKFYEEPLASWLYLKDEWAKAHPIFDGLPAGGLMDNTFYREIIPDSAWIGQDPPLEAIAGAIKASQDYSSGLMVAAYSLGAGRFVLNTLLIRENLGHPVAERLLRNMLRYAARDINEPLVQVPSDFDQLLKAIGYL